MLPKQRRTGETQDTKQAPDFRAQASSGAISNNAVSSKPNFNKVSSITS